MRDATNISFYRSIAVESTKVLELSGDLSEAHNSDVTHYSKEYLMYNRQHNTTWPSHLPEPHPFVSLTINSKSQYSFVLRVPIDKDGKLIVKPEPLFTVAKIGKKKAKKINSDSITKSNANAWISYTMPDRQEKIIMDKKDSDSDLKRKITLILNKVTSDTIEYFFQEIRSLDLRERSRIMIFVAQIVSHARSGPFYAHLYAQLCSKLVSYTKSTETSITNIDISSGVISYSEDLKKNMIDACQEEFDVKLKFAVNMNNNVSDKIGQTLTSRIIRKLEKAINLRFHFIGILLFIGQLFVHDLLNEYEIYRYLNILCRIQFIDEENIEFLCIIILQIGEKLDSIPNSFQTEKFFQYILDQSIEVALPRRIQLLIERIQKLRQLNWIEQSYDLIPRTQIRKKREKKDSAGTEITEERRESSDIKSIESIIKPKLNVVKTRRSE